MHSKILTLLTETSLHPGSGRSTGIVDLPVAREATTGYPVIVGSSLKGALRDKARETITEEKVSQLFGKPDNAGKILVSDARLLLLPVRSLSGCYRWITCPYLLERLQRDLARSSLAATFQADLSNLKPCGGQYLASNASGQLVLEERVFEAPAQTETTTENWSKLLETLVSLFPGGDEHEPTGERVAGQLVIVCDEDFAWFARYGLPVNARNVLNPETKTSKNLWYEESLPPDSLFYAVLDTRQEAEGDALHELLQTNPYLQVGGNETTGMGWCALRLLSNENQKGKAGHHGQ